MMTFLSKVRVRHFASNNPGHNALFRIEQQLIRSFENIEKLHVEDISGGCGSMFAIHITSPAFRGIPVVQQHRLVQEALKDEIRLMHGINIKTSVS